MIGSINSGFSVNNSTGSPVIKTHKEHFQGIVDEINDYERLLEEYNFWQEAAYLKHRQIMQEQIKAYYAKLDLMEFFQKMDRIQGLIVMRDLQRELHVTNSRVSNLHITVSELINNPRIKRIFNN